MPQPTAPDEPTHPESHALLRTRAIAFDAASSVGAIHQLDALLAPDVASRHSTAVAAGPMRPTRRPSTIEVELHASSLVTSVKPTGRPDAGLPTVRVHRAAGASRRTSSYPTLPGAARAANITAQQ